MIALSKFLSVAKLIKKLFVINSFLSERPDLKVSGYSYSYCEYACFHAVTFFIIGASGVMKIIASKYEIAETKLVLKAPFSITPDTFNLMFSLDADGLVHYLSFFL